MSDLIFEIWRRDRRLALTGWLNLTLLAAMLCMLPFDSRTPQAAVL